MPDSPLSGEGALSREVGHRPVRIHATNIAGIGAVQLIQSLLPAMEQVSGFELTALYLPAAGPLGVYRSRRHTTVVIRKKRILPNAISRILECTLLARNFDGDGELLVLGDIPLRCRGPQTVFVQTPLLTSGARARVTIGAVKYIIARCLFRLNAKFASAFIVQTEAMRHALSQTYPEISGRIHVIGQPPPEWLLMSGLRRAGPTRAVEAGLRLFYPAAPYPHKNHRLLSRIEEGTGRSWPVSELVLTIADNFNPNSSVPWLRCVGHLSPLHVLAEYQNADALLFLSLSESLGFPLLEAMWIGLPIICPDLPYARVLCGNAAIYFEPDDIESLRSATMELHRRLREGWWPDWSGAATNMPGSWNEVAVSMLKIASGRNAGADR